MKVSRFAKVGLVLVVAVAITASFARANTEVNAHTVGGEAVVQQPGGKWTSQAELGSGQLIRSTKDNTVIRIPGATIRLESGATLRFDASQVEDQLQARIGLKNGRVFVSVEDQATCSVDAMGLKVKAGCGQFVLDADRDQLFVLDGDAAVVARTSRTGGSVLDSPRVSSSPLLALGDPDVRNMATKRRKFAQGEEDTEGRLGEDAPGTSSPTPAGATSKASNPSSVETGSPPPPVQGSLPPEFEVGGGPDGSLTGGLAGGLGVAAFFLSRGNGRSGTLSTFSTGNDFNSVDIATSP